MGKATPVPARRVDRVMEMVRDGIKQTEIATRLNLTLGEVKSAVAVYRRCNP